MRFITIRLKSCCRVKKGSLIESEICCDCGDRKAVEVGNY
jgi:hypothetical protein